MKAGPPGDLEIYLYFSASALHPSPDISCAFGSNFSTESGFSKFSVDMNCKQNMNAVWHMLKLIKKTGENE